MPEINRISELNTNFKNLNLILVMKSTKKIKMKDNREGNYLACIIRFEKPHLFYRFPLIKI